MAGSSELFRNVVETVFNNWTALRLAVEHGMGGQNGKDIALELVNQVTDLFCNTNIGAEEVSDFLIDYMDSQFQTLCEDNSPEELGAVLWQFHQHCKAGNYELVNLELSKLPKCELWLCKPLQPNEKKVEAVISNSNENNVAMEEGNDPEWIQVKMRHRKERTVV